MCINKHWHMQMEIQSNTYCSLVAVYVDRNIHDMHNASCKEDAIWFGLKAHEWVHRNGQGFINDGIEGKMRKLFVKINTALRECANLKWPDYYFDIAGEQLDEDHLLDAMLAAINGSAVQKCPKGNNHFVAVTLLLELWAKNPVTLSRLRRDHPGLDKTIWSFVDYWHRTWPLTKVYPVKA